LRLLDLKYPVQVWLDAFDMEEDFPEVRPQSCWLLIWIKGDHIWRMPLDRLGVELLSRLVAGITLGEAMNDVLARGRIRPATLFERLSGWLAEGLFYDLALAPQSELPDAARR
jgi:hypothetical protein